MNEQDSIEEWQALSDAQIVQWLGYYRDIGWGYGQAADNGRFVQNRRRAIAEARSISRSIRPEPGGDWQGKQEFVPGYVPPVSQAMQMVNRLRAVYGISPIGQGAAVTEGRVDARIAAMTDLELGNAIKAMSRNPAAEKGRSEEHTSELQSHA